MKDETTSEPTELAITDDQIQALLRQGYRLVRDGAQLRLLPPRRHRQQAAGAPVGHTTKRHDPAKAKAKRKAARAARRRNPPDVTRSDATTEPGGRMSTIDPRASQRRRSSPETKRPRASWMNPRTGD